MKLFQFKSSVLLALSILVAAIIPCAHAETAHKECFVYFGTFTGGNSKGIYISHLDQETGILTKPALACPAVNPGFLDLSPDGKHLYAVGGSLEVDGKRTGAAASFAIDPANGNLSQLNEVSTIGQGPCHIVVDKSGSNVLVANYGSGSVAAIPIQPDGRLGKASSFIQHTGSSVDKDRQKGPHAHGFALDRSGTHAYACDLGTDKVMIYTLDSTGGLLAPNEPEFFQVKPGSGPRHIAFHPSGRFAYIINEMGGSVTVAKYDEKTGGLTELQNISTLAEDFTEKNTCAEIAVHPSGRFVYASNRGEDTIAVFEINVKTGKLTFVERQPTLGNTPRGFGIDPTGKYLIVGNMDSGTVAVFRINLHSGKLQKTGQLLECPSAVCVQFLERKN